MLSVPLIHHVYSSVGGYKTIYATQDPAAQRIHAALVAVANTAYKGGMGATFRGFLRFQLPVRADATPPRTQFGPWQLPPAIAFGCGRWYLKSFPMGTDHVGRPRACVHSVVMLPERINPPPWWQPNPLSQFESSLFSTYDFPADTLFLHGRDSLQGLRERTRDQIPWQPTDLLNRPAGLEWLTSGNLPPALVGSMIKLLLFPGSRLWVLASEEHALFLARVLECVLPGGYRRTGGLLLGPHVRYLVPPLSPPNLIQIARPSEYPAGECLIDLSSTPPRWIGPEPPTSPLAGAILEYLNRGDLTGLLKFIEMWDIFDEQSPTPARQVAGLTVMNSLRLIGPLASNDPWPDWTRDAPACASALPFFLQAGWLSAHDTAWHQVKIALKRIGAEHLTGEVKAWEAYIDLVRQNPTLPPPPPPSIKGIVSELEGPSHSNILRSIPDSLPDPEWEVKGSGHAIPAIPIDPADATDQTDVDAEFDIPADHIETTDQSLVTLEPGTNAASTEPATNIEPITESEVPSDSFDVDAEFALPAIPGQSGRQNRPEVTADPEPETVQEDWTPPPPPPPHASPKPPSAAAGAKPGSGSAAAKPAPGTPQPAAGPQRKSGQGAVPPRISSALEADGETKLPLTSLPRKPAPFTAAPQKPPADKLPLAKPMGHVNQPAPTKPRPLPTQPPLRTTQSGTLIHALDMDAELPAESDHEGVTDSSSIILVSADELTGGDPTTATAEIRAADSGTLEISADEQANAGANAAAKPGAKPPAVGKPAEPIKPAAPPRPRPSGQGPAKPLPAAQRPPGGSSGNRPVAKLLEPHEHDDDDSEIIDLTADEDDADLTPPPPPARKSPGR